MKTEDPWLKAWVDDPVFELMINNQRKRLSFEKTIDFVGKVSENISNFAEKDLIEFWELYSSIKNSKNIKILKSEGTKYETSFQ